MADDEPIIYNENETDRMLIVDGVALKSPSEFTWGLYDVSDASSGRTQDALMHKNRIAQKRKIELEWQGLSAADTHDILVAFQPEYVTVQYYDPLDSADPNTLSTRLFYTGDKSAPVYSWFIGGERYEKVTFNIIEV